MTHSVALNFADGKTFFISVQNVELLLNAAIRQGITLPLDCREGVCGTCQGQCETGMALLHKPICKGFFSDIIFK